MQSKRFNAPILWCIFIALPAHAATIKDAFELASQIDAPVQVAQQVKAQSALRNAESLTPEPLSLTVSGTNSLNDYLSPTQGAREYEAEMGIPLWQWGQKERLLAQLKQASHAEQSQLLLSRWALAGAVREAVWAARLAQLEQQNAAQILKSLEGIAQDQVRQLKAGEVSPLDANLANQAVLEAQLQLAQRQQELKAHLQHFHSLVGEPITVPVQDENLPAQLDVIHPQRVLLQAESELARAHLAQSQYDTRDNPELALSLTRERGSPGEEFKNLGKISLRIPLGSDGRTKARISRANAELISAQANTQRTERQITAQQQAAEQARQFASQSAQWAEQSLKLATQAWEWQQRSYRAGQTGLAAYLNAQRDFLARSFAVQRAQLELGRAQSRYLQTMGVLP